MSERSISVRSHVLFCTSHLRVHSLSLIGRWWCWRRRRRRSAGEVSAVCRLYVNVNNRRTRGGGRSRGCVRGIAGRHHCARAPTCTPWRTRRTGCTRTCALCAPMRPGPLTHQMSTVLAHVRVLYEYSVLVARTRQWDTRGEMLHSTHRAGCRWTARCRWSHCESARAAWPPATAARHTRTWVQVDYLLPHRQADLTLEE